MKPSLSPSLLLCISIWKTTAAQNVNYWIDGSCTATTTLAINEAKVMAQQTSDILRSVDPLDPDIDALLFKFFDITKDNFPTEVGLIANTYQRIGQLQQVTNHDDSLIRIYCDGMTGFVNDADQQPLPDDGSVQPKAQVLFPAENMLAYADNLCFRYPYLVNIGFTPAAVTFYDPGRGFRQQQRPDNQPEDRSVMWVSQSSIRIWEQSKSVVSSDLRYQPLDSRQSITPFNLMSSLLLHEFVHIPELADFVYTPQGSTTAIDVERGLDMHQVDPNQPPVSGYVEAKFDSSTPPKAVSGTLPGPALQNPLYTMANPDSYAMLAFGITMKGKGWTMYCEDGTDLVKFKSSASGAIVHSVHHGSNQTEPVQNGNWTLSSDTIAKRSSRDARRTRARL